MNKPIKENYLSHKTSYLRTGQKHFRFKKYSEDLELYIVYILTQLEALKDIINNK